MTYYAVCWLLRHGARRQSPARRVGVMQFIGEANQHSVEATLGQNRPIFGALPEYCRIAIETLTYLTDLRLLEGLCRGATGPLVRVSRLPGTLLAGRLQTHPRAVFHGARLHHAGVLICRDFCLGVGRGVGARVRCAHMGRGQPTGDQLQDRG